MKILAVIPSLGRGGAERSVSRLSLEWAKGHAVTVAVFDGSRTVFPHGGTQVDLAVPPGGGMVSGIRRVLRLRRLLRSLGPDRVFAFMETANIPVMLAALLSGYRHRVTLSMRGNPDRMRWSHKALAFCLYGFAARVVVVSRGAAARLAAIVPACRPKLEVIYSPLPLGQIADLVLESPPETGPEFFAAGRLVSGKAFGRMIELFAGAECAGARLWIAGEGPEREHLQALIRARGLEDRVRLTGALENPFALMARARAFLMTSEHEGFPVALIEALACGCPPVAFDCDFGPREAIVDGETGFLVPPEDDALFKARLGQLFADDALRARLSEAARLRARDFDAPRVAAQWLNRGEKAA